jgi:uncharacterized damage-inducible protein DinB
MTPEASETQMLRNTLDRQRQHVLGILGGLSEDQLTQPVLPSGWSCLGLVNHLALDVEHYWFRCILGGEPLDFFAEAHARGGWEVGSIGSAGEVLDLYRAEIERANAVLSVTNLETAPRQRDDWWGDWDVPNARFVILHVIAETACHAGHLDATRELLDGRQWVVL